MNAGELLLIDAGVEVDSLYTADITRTFPTNGKFTDFQKKLYQAVLDSQQAGFEAAKPGATYSDIHHACMRVIAERLHDWGILPVDVEESLSPEASSTAVGSRAAWHTTWGSTCTTARRRGTSRTKARRSRRAWCSRSNRDSTSARTT